MKNNSSFRIDGHTISVGELLEIASRAGTVLLSHRNQIPNYKEDGSPVTKADLETDVFLRKNLPFFPIVSEENCPEFSVRKNWSVFWLVDPLDGTKDFLAGYDDFSINIALIEQQKPVFGIVHLPKRDTSFFALKNQGAYRYRNNQQERLPSDKITYPLIAESRSHRSLKTEEWMKKHHYTSSVKVAGAMKFCLLAQETASHYPRLIGSSEWDTAAGQIILEESGGKVLEYETLLPLLYNKASIRNPYFIGYSKTFSSIGNTHEQLLEYR